MLDVEAIGKSTITDDKDNVIPSFEWTVLDGIEKDTSTFQNSFWPLDWPKIIQIAPDKLISVGGVDSKKNGEA